MNDLAEKLLSLVSSDSESANTTNQVKVQSHAEHVNELHTQDKTLGQMVFRHDLEYNGKLSLTSPFS